MILPALNGTLNVLRACSEANIKRVVVVSSIVAVYMDPDSPRGRIVDESNWSNKEDFKSTGVISLSLSLSLSLYIYIYIYIYISTD